MNIPRLIGTIIAVFIGIQIMDFLIHAVWLKDTYGATASLWRPEGEMKKYMGWMMFGQFLAASMFVLLWAKGFASTASIRNACTYGVCMALFAQATTFITYAVQPLPFKLVICWVAGGMMQGLLLGLLVYFVYKPKTA